MSRPGHGDRQGPSRDAATKLRRRGFPVLEHAAHAVARAQPGFGRLEVDFARAAPHRLKTKRRSQSSAERPAVSSGSAAWRASRSSSSSSTPHRLRRQKHPAGRTAAVPPRARLRADHRFRLQAGDLADRGDVVRARGVEQGDGQGGAENVQRHDPALAGEAGRDEPQHRFRDLVALEVDRGHPELVAQEADEIVAFMCPRRIRL